MLRALTHTELHHFKTYGYLVKKQVISPDLISLHQKEIRSFIKKNANIYETKHGEFTNLRNFDMVSTGFGGMVEFMWGEAQSFMRDSPEVYDIHCDLYAHTYSTSSSALEQWPNGLGQFSPSEMYSFVNKCCFRIPSRHFSAELKHLDQGTGAHIDLNPFDPFSSNLTDASEQKGAAKPLMFWQPIQGLVAVSENRTANGGGFQTIPGFHLECKAYFEQKRNEWSAEERSLKRLNQIHLSEKHTPELMKRFVHIPVEKGDYLLWDWRMPHLNEAENRSDTVREVVYVAHLPAVPLNKQYAIKQLEWYRTGAHPTYMSKKHRTLEMTPAYRPFSHSVLGRKLMGLEAW